MPEGFAGSGGMVRVLGAEMLLLARQEVLLEGFLVPMALSQNAVARAIGVPPRRINEIVLGQRPVTADTALRLAKAFGTSEAFWLGLQADYDLEEARKALSGDLKKVERLPEYRRGHDTQSRVVK